MKKRYCLSWLGGVSACPFSPLQPSGWGKCFVFCLLHYFWCTEKEQRVLFHTSYRLREVTGLDSCKSVTFPETLLKCLVSKIGMGSKTAFIITLNGKTSHSIFLKLYNLHLFFLSSFCIQCANKNSHAFYKWDFCYKICRVVFCLLLAFRGIKIPLSSREGLWSSTFFHNYILGYSFGSSQGSCLHTRLE